MDKEIVILTIQVYNKDKNAFKYSSSENITYDELKLKTIEEFKVSEDNIKYMSFYYEDNEGNKNYIYEDDELGKLAEEIAPGNLLLKLNFEINLYESRKSRVSPSNIIIENKKIQSIEENFQDDQKKLKKEIIESKINELNRIIKEKNEEILFLKSKEKENEALEIKNEIKNIENELKNDIKNFTNKLESTKNELIQSLKIIENNKIKNLTDFGNTIQNLDSNFIFNNIKKLLNELVENQKSFESKAGNIIEKIENKFSKLNTQIIDLFDVKSKEIINKTNENINIQLKQIIEAISNNNSKLEKINIDSEFNSHDKNINKNDNVINDNENSIRDNENIIKENKIISTNKFKNIIHQKSQCQQCLAKPIKGIKYECLECGLNLCFDCHNNLVIRQGSHTHNFKEINHVIEKTIKDEINDFLKDFFFEKEIIVSKKEISDQNILKFLKFNTELKKELNEDLNEHLKLYINWQLQNFKNKNDCDYDKDMIIKNYDKRRKKLEEKLNKTVNLIEKFRKKYKLNKNDYTDKYLFIVLNNFNDDFEKAINKIRNKSNS